MVVKSELKLIKSLRQKKYRTRHKLFVAEGVKTNQALLGHGLTPYLTVISEDKIPAGLPENTKKITPGIMEEISSLKTASPVLGVYHFPLKAQLEFLDWVVALDHVADPGNLGTIIRLCDWFGVEHLVCSPLSVDCFNPKVVQATMGSIARVHVHYRELDGLLRNSPVPVYGGFMEGEELGRASVPERGVLVMGSEAHGISGDVASNIPNKWAIPSHGQPVAESLNVAMATAIFLREIRRDVTRK